MGAGDYCRQPLVLADVELEAVPVLYVGEYYDGVAERYAEGQSRLWPTQMREGCVIETVETPRRKAKYVGQEYLLRKDA